MTKLYILGLDQAFAKSGWALLSWDGSKLAYEESGVFNPTIKWGHASDCIAFLEHGNYLTQLIKRINTKGELAVIGMEGVAFAASGQAVTKGGIFGLYAVKSVLEADLVVITPTKLKLYVTDDGHAEKEDIRDVIAPRYQLSFDLEFDEYDAIGLAEMAFYSWGILHGFDKHIKLKLPPEKYKIFWDKTEVIKYKKAKKDKKTGKKLPRVKKSGKSYGICNRIDDFYIYKKVA